jgi:hypothetical protein
MSISSNTNNINSPFIQFYEWIIQDREAYNPTTIGVIATSLEQARNLLLDKLEKQQLLADGIAVADINFTGPYTYFPGSIDRLEMFNQDDISYRSISRAILEASIKCEPLQIVPINIGTTILFSAMDG